jgi:subtilisin family serine protease
MTCTDNPKGNNIDGLKKQVEDLAGVVVLKTFESEIFTGLSVDTSNATADTPVDSLRAARHAWPMRTIKRANLPNAERVFDDDLSAKNYSLHRYTGVDKLHAAGHFGKGAVIAVIDTGIDYNHPAVSSALRIAG